MLCNHLPLSSFKTFHYPQNRPIPIKPLVLFLLPFSPWEPPIFLPSLWIYLILDISYKWNHTIDGFSYVTILTSFWASVSPIIFLSLHVFCWKIYELKWNCVYKILDRNPRGMQAVQSLLFHCLVLNHSNYLCMCIDRYYTNLLGLK